MSIARLLIPLLALACAPVDEAPEAVDDPPVVDEPVEPAHPCEVATREAFDAGRPWTPDQVDACYLGCDDGAEDGFDQGRLVCIAEGDYCDACAPAQADPAYDAGYEACYAEAYADGYVEEGCQIPDEDL